MIDKLPQSFIKKLQDIYSIKELEIIEKWFNKIKRPTTFRVNTLKASNEEIEEFLNKKNLKFEKISYLENGYKLIDWIEKDLWDLKIFKEWKIYLQWITSQLVWEILKDFSKLSLVEKVNLKILDLTASPWWKSAHLSSILNNKWTIYANELNTIRYDKLKFTIERQWCENIELLKKDANNLKDELEEDFFDIIIADLPCSAEWRINFSKEKSYKYLEKPWVNKKNYLQQKDILKNNIALLKTWWVLIYSTCTIDPLENEWIVHFLLSNNKNLVLEDISNYFQDENIKKYIKNWLKSFDKSIYQKDSQKTIRIIPSVETEWFFIAKFKKV